MLEIIREAYGDNGDNVLLTETPIDDGDTIYSVYLYRHETRHTLQAFYKLALHTESKNQIASIVDDANTVFEEALDFMGLTEAKEDNHD